jgi:hypothetical protein
MSDGGKGSSPRPYSVDQKTYSDNWDQIFKKSRKEAEDSMNEEEAFRLIEVMNQHPKSNTEQSF